MLGTSLGYILPSLRISSALPPEVQEGLEVVSWPQGQGPEKISGIIAGGQVSCGFVPVTATGMEGLCSARTALSPQEHVLGQLHAQSMLSPRATDPRLSGA